MPAASLTFGQPSPETDVDAPEAIQAPPRRGGPWKGMAVGFGFIAVLLAGVISWSVTTERPVSEILIAARELIDRF